MGGGRRWEDGREGVERAVVDVAVVGEETAYEAEAKWKCLQMREEELSVRESEHAFGGLPSEDSRPET